MKTKEVRNVKSTKLDGLANEVLRLFREAVSTRSYSGVTSSMRLGYIRDVVESCEEQEPFVETTQESCGDTCSTGGEGDVGCEPELENACTIEDTLDAYRNNSPFKSVANLLTTVKKYEFISLVENAYAQIGNKPFKLKAGKDPSLTEEQIKESAEAFYEFLENYLEANQVRINEIPDAFNLDTLSEVTTALADVAQDDATIRIQNSIAKNEAVMERIFQRSEFMSKYIEVIKDTADYPIGVMWVDDKSLKKQRVVKNGKLTLNYSIQSDVHRVDPIYFWATEDHRLNEVGRAVFRLCQFSRGDLKRWVENDVTGSKKLTKNLNEFVDNHEDGYRMYEAMLFRDHYDLLHAGTYDVMISRGMFDVEHIKELDVKIPDIYKDESYLPCEVYFSSSHILRVRVMECADEHLGVYTTVFRRKGQSIFGYSLHEFIYPFAKLYGGAIDAVDRSVGKSIGSFIQVDTGVLEDPDRYLMKNDKTGEVELNLSDDVVIEFDSSNGFTSPNFKGVPITVTQLPSDLNKLIPVIDFIHGQLERISGIPSILVNGSNVSSALRTNSNYNAAFQASAKVIQSLLRESETRILSRAIRFIFDAKAASGDMSEFLTEAEPEILLSDTLSRELNDDQQLLQGVQTLAQFAGAIPEENLAKLINTVGREVYNLDEDLIPDTGLLSTSQPSQQAQPV